MPYYMDCTDRAVKKVFDLTPRMPAGTLNHHYLITKACELLLIPGTVKTRLIGKSSATNARARDMVTKAQRKWRAATT